MWKPAGSYLVTDVRCRGGRTREKGTYFDDAELEDFDRYLRRPWIADGVKRPKVPEWIEAHLRAESGNQCLRCGAGRGVETVDRRADSTPIGALTC